MGLRLSLASGQGTQVLAAGQEHSLNDIPGPVKVVGYLKVGYAQ